MVFPVVDYIYGPYFDLKKESTTKTQIDLVFSRADNVISVCEIKHSLQPIGKEIIAQVEHKIDLLKSKFPRKTFQRVLITMNKPTDSLISASYFYKIILAEDLL